MSNETTAATPWAPTAGERAWWGGNDGQNVTVKRVHKGGTVTIQGWGRALLEGKLVTWRGISARNLSAPRKMGNLDPVTGKRIWLVAA